MNRELVKHVANYCDTSGCSCGHASRKRRAIAGLVELGLKELILSVEEFEEVCRKLAERGSRTITAGSKVLEELSATLSTGVVA